MQVLGPGQCVQQSKWWQIRLSHREGKPTVKQNTVNSFLIVAVNLVHTPIFQNQQFNKTSQDLKNAKSSAIRFGLEERVINLEEHLKLRPVQKELYLRLKDIENRVLYLEGLSPEYFEGDSKALSILEQNGNKQLDCSQKAQRMNQNANNNFGTSNGMEVDVENTQYKEALSNSLSVINKRIQELQTKLRNSV